MKTSEPPRNTMARNPSHFGSYKKGPAGIACASFASIGSMGGSMGNDIEKLVIYQLLLSQFRGAGFERCRQRAQAHCVATGGRCRIGLGLPGERLELFHRRRGVPVAAAAQAV